MIRIGIIGHFGGNEFFADGQTVKVKSLVEAMEQYAPEIHLDKVDTYYAKKAPIKFIWSFLKCLVVDKRIIFFPATNSRKVLFPFFYYLGKVTGKEFYHDCIAGSMSKHLKERPSWVKYLGSYSANWMESPEEVNAIKQMGLNNVSYMPNFKHLTPLTADELKNMEYSKPYKFCTFSRIESLKGIEDALIAIQEVNKIHPGAAYLDIYGPVQPGSEEWFEEIKKKYADICEYKGIVMPNESVEAVKNYVALLFPTQYFTEGMPGTIVDAMFAGVPVVARRWKWCDNMIKDRYNGLVYEFDQPEKLKDLLLEVVEDINLIKGMKHNCIIESDKYAAGPTITRILKEMKLR